MDFKSLNSSLHQMTGEFWELFLKFLPQLTLVIVLLVAGWLLGRLARTLARRLVLRHARQRTGPAMEQALNESGVDRMASEIIGRIAFWAILLIFAALAGEVLGLAVVSSGLAVLIRYLPSVLAAGLIGFAGLVLSNLARDAVMTLSTTGRFNGKIPGQLVRYAILLLTTVVALDQIGIDSTLLILATGILLAGLLGSATLAVGLGARAEVGNIIALHYLAKSYSVGQKIRIGEVEGRIVELSANGVVLDTDQGRTTVPGREFSERSSCLIDEAA